MRYRTVYYREPNGDFMLVGYAARLPDGELVFDPRTKDVGVLFARSACIEHLPSSVCTCSPSRAYIKTCTPVRKADVPAEWLNWINPE